MSSTASHPLRRVLSVHLRLTRVIFAVDTGRRQLGHRPGTADHLASHPLRGHISPATAPGPGCPFALDLPLRPAGA